MIRNKHVVCVTAYSDAATPLDFLSIVSKHGYHSAEGMYHIWQIYIKIYSGELDISWI